MEVNRKMNRAQTRYWPKPSSSNAPKAVKFTIKRASVL
jgi:hypothetical protein